MREQVRIFVGTPLHHSESDMALAILTAKDLIKRNCLPICPFLHAMAFESSDAEYRSVRLNLLGVSHGSIWIGPPELEEKEYIDSTPDKPFQMLYPTEETREQSN